MSILNGLSGLAAGLNAFSQNAAADKADAAAAEKEQPPASVESAPVVPSEATAPPPGATAPPPAATIAASASVPPKLLPIYEAASRRTGIPVAVLIAQGRQESGFDLNAVSKTGAIGIAQILPSTARDPGYGVKPVDPSTLRDPEVAINFQADYMRARAGLGADFNHPATVDAALRAYNGGSSPGADPNYVANVRRYMRGT